MSDPNPRLETVPSVPETEPISSVASSSPEETAELSPAALPMVRRPWLFASVPSIIFFVMVALAARSRLAPDRAPSPQDSSSMAARGAAAPAGPMAQQGVLAASQTLVVSQVKMAGFVTLRGSLERAVKVRGRAPMAGRVSHVLVVPGQQVHENDRVLEIATTASRSASRRAESAQDSAESAQVAAVGQQQTLEVKLQAAQKRLLAAQDRVKTAGTRLAAAREVVRKLQRGESVRQGDADSAASGDDTETRPAPDPRRATADSAESRHLQLAAEDAARASHKLEMRAASARLAADAADEALRKTSAKVDEMKAASEKVQKLFDSGTARASDVDAARANLDDAQAAANAARPRAADARREAARLTAAAAQARDDSQHVQREAAAASSARVADAASADDHGGHAARKPEGGQGGLVSVSDAASMVRSAIAESDDAAADAHRIKESVDDYDRQVRDTQNRLSSTGNRLEDAQNKLIDETIAHNLSIVRAPADGTVLSVASPDQVIDFGETIVQIGHAGVLQLQLFDSSEAWKQLRPGDTLNARVEDSGIDASQEPIVAARITDVDPPDFRHARATITAIVDPQVGLHEGVRLVCSLVKPGPTPALVVPAVSILPVSDGIGTVAVLTRSTDKQAAADSVPFRIEWREVRLGAGDGIEQEVQAGLGPGERIALQPEALKAYALNTGADELQLETKL